MAKYGFNERWRDRDRAYRELPDALLERLFALISALADQFCPRKRGPGQPPKVGPKEAAFLAVIKEHHREMPYRELASSRYVKWLGIAGVHYTTIQKAIDRLPEELLEAAARSLAELVSSKEIDCVADATKISIRKYEERTIRMKKRRVRQTVGLSLLWDAEKRVFHAFFCFPGEGHEMNTLQGLVDSVRVKIRRLFGDRGFSSRDNVQHLADRKIEPVIRVQESATPRIEGHPAWGEHVKHFRELGYERWRDETGYGKRFPEEHTIGALINRFEDELKISANRMASKLLGARVVLHNFFAALFNGCFIAPA